MSRYRTQQGVALITALLVVTLAAVAAVAMTARQQVDIRRTQNVLEAEQLRLYLHGVEAWAGKVLEQDRKDNAVDHPGEDWATHLPPIPLDNGQLSGHIEDLQGRFNLNNLLLDGKTSPEDLARLRRLLAALEQSPNLADAVVDWIDANLEPWPPHGAEDTTYLGREPPYRAANRPMTEISELRLVAGFDADSYRLLAPHVSTLPGRTAINLNSAGVEVIMALADGISRADAERFVAEREGRHFDKVEDAIKHAALARHNIAAESLSVASEHFVVMSDVSVGRLQQRHASLLSRNANGAVTVLMRHQLFF